MDSLFEPQPPDPPAWESDLARERRVELEEARRRRDQGARAAELNTWPPYRSRFLEHVRSLPVGTEFTTDDIAAEIGPPAASSRNAMGGLTRAAIAEGLMVAVGFAQSTRASRNGGYLRVWRRVIPS